MAAVIPLGDGGGSLGVGGNDGGGGSGSDGGGGDGGASVGAAATSGEDELRLVPRGEEGKGIAVVADDPLRGDGSSPRMWGEEGVGADIVADDLFSVGIEVRREGKTPSAEVTPADGRECGTAVATTDGGGDKCAAVSGGTPCGVMCPSGDSGGSGGGGGGGGGGHTPLPRRFARMTRSLSHILWTTGPAVLRRRRKGTWAVTRGGGSATTGGPDATGDGGGGGGGGSGDGGDVAGGGAERLARVVHRLSTGMVTVAASWARRSLAGGGGCSGGSSGYSRVCGAGKLWGRPWDRSAAAVAAVAVPVVVFWVLLYGLAGVGRDGGGHGGGGGGVLLLSGRAGGGSPRSLLPLSTNVPRWPYMAVYDRHVGRSVGVEAARLILRVRPGAGEAEVAAALASLTTADFAYDAVGLEVWFPPPTLCGVRRGRARQPCAAGGRGDRVDAAALATARAYHWRFGDYRVVLLAPPAVGSGAGAVAAAMLAAGAAAAVVPSPRPSAGADAFVGPTAPGGASPLARTDPLTIFLDSAVQVSPHFYTWLTAATVSYGSRPDVAGYSLLLSGEDEPPSVSSTGGHHVVASPAAEGRESMAGVAVLQQRLRWAAYAPAPAAWRRFRAYAQAAADPASGLSVAALPPPRPSMPETATAAVVSDDGGVNDLAALYTRYMAVMDLATVGLDVAREVGMPRLARQLPVVVMAAAAAAAAADAGTAGGLASRYARPLTLPLLRQPTVLVGALSSAATAAGLPPLRDGLLRPAVVVDVPPAGGGGSGSGDGSLAGGVSPVGDRWAPRKAVFAFPADPERLNWGGWPVLHQGTASSDPGVAAATDAAVTAVAGHPTPHVVVLSVGSDAALFGGLSLACHFGGSTRPSVAAPVASAASVGSPSPLVASAPVVVFAVTSPDVGRVLSLLPPLHANGTAPQVLATSPSSGAGRATARRDALVGALLRRGVGVSIVDAPAAGTAAASASSLAAIAAAAAPPPPFVDVVGTLPLGRAGSSGGGGDGGVDAAGGGAGGVLSSALALAPTAAALRVWHAALRGGATGGPVTALPPPPGAATGGVRLGLGVPPGAPEQAAEEALVGAVFSPSAGLTAATKGGGQEGSDGCGWVWHPRVKSCVALPSPSPGGGRDLNVGGGLDGGGHASFHIPSITELNRELAASAAAATATRAAASPPGVAPAAVVEGSTSREEVVVHDGHVYRRTWRRVKLVDWVRAHSGGAAGG
ncbi:hypothetical protein MMPV_008313 [Pyropia vietnamensis]